MSKLDANDKRLSPIVFANHARDFLDAAEREFAARQAPGVPDFVVDVSIAGYFLAGRAIELALKGFLLLRGASEAKLRKVSHNLKKALRAADEAGMRELVTLEEGHVEALVRVNEYYFRKDLEYVTTGYKSYPDHKWVLGCAETILDGIEPALRKWRRPAPEPSESRPDDGNEDGNEDPRKGEK